MESLRWSAIIPFTLVLFQALTPSGSAQAPAITLGADFRYRYENITLEGTDTRVRHRIRALVGVTGIVNEEVTVGLQLGSGNDVPFSKNQTLTGGFSSKQVLIDLAYFEYRPEPARGLAIRGGKMRNPFYTAGNTELVWDNDLRPEGIAAVWAVTRGTLAVNLAGSYFLIDERPSARDAVLLGGQARVSYAPRPATVHLGAGYYDYRNARGRAPFYATATPFGNSVGPDGSYREGFRELNTFIEVSPRALAPNTTLFADYVVNLAEDVDDNRGWLAGVSAGRLSDPGSFAFRYTYRRIEADAVVGVFTDDDFGGGGTNASGHEVNFDYQAGTHAMLGATWYANQKGLADGADYHRLMLDFSFRF